MTLQIVFVRVAGQDRVQLHGRLTRAEIPDFQAACASQAEPVCIDLENLTGASAEGFLALKQQRGRGAHLTGASPYIELSLAGSVGADPGGRKPGSSS